MLKNYILIGGLIMLVACSSTPPPPVTKQIMLPTAIAGTAIPENEIDSVRFGENVKAYTVGRYIDPNNSDIMHEKNVIYRIEENCSWNTMPNEPFSLPFRRYESNRQKLINIQRPLTSELEAEIGRQKQLREKLKENNDAINNTLGISQKTNQNVEKVIGTSLALSRKVSELEGQIYKMKTREKKNLMIIKQLLEAQNALSHQLHEEMKNNRESRTQLNNNQEPFNFNLGFDTQHLPGQSKKNKKPEFPQPPAMKEKKQ